MWSFLGQFWLTICSLIPTHSDIQDLANEGNIHRIQRIQAVAERGQGGAPSSSPPASSSYSPNGNSSPAIPSHNPYSMPRPSSNSYSSYSNMPPKMTPRMSHLIPSPARPTADIIAENIRFKPSPFFTIVEQLILPRELKGRHTIPNPYFRGLLGPARENTRDNMEIDVTLGPAVADRLQKDQTMRVMVYCAGDTGLSPYTLSDVAFPHQVELKCNLDEIKANLRGLKNKPGSTRPADITQLIRKKAGYPNKVTVTWALTTKVCIPSPYKYPHHALKY